VLWSLCFWVRRRRYKEDSLFFLSPLSSTVRCTYQLLITDFTIFSVSALSRLYLTYFDYFLGDKFVPLLRTDPRMFILWTEPRKICGVKVVWRRWKLMYWITLKYYLMLDKWNRIRLEKLIVAQIFKKFLVCHETRKFCVYKLFPNLDEFRQNIYALFLWHRYTWVLLFLQSAPRSQECYVPSGYECKMLNEFIISVWNIILASPVSLGRGFEWRDWRKQCENFRGIWHNLFILFLSFRWASFWLVQPLFNLLNVARA
jgi:hypothetical protein